MKEEILSVGIDIGTSTTQLVFSNITIENTASAFSIPKIDIVGKEIVYKSDIYFTPLSSKTEIDGKIVREIIEKEYRKAGLAPGNVQTGAVIITGETARKDNAKLILESLTGLAGEFVVATAGPDLESIIAGKGAGAEQLSKEKRAVVINLDIGGGTTNIAVFRNGKVIDTTCLDVGGRLIKFGDLKELEVDYIAPKIQQLAKGLDIDVKSRFTLTQSTLDKVVKKMVEVLEEVLGIKEKTKTLKALLTTSDLRRDYDIDYISFSGGVADYIYSSYEGDLFKYRDIGILLGQHIMKSELMKNFKIHQPDETIRATVVGAGSHTTDISGSTITFTENIFPLKNIPILKITEEEEKLGYEGLGNKIKEKMSWFSLENEIQQVALSIKGVNNASFGELQKIARCIVEGMSKVVKLDAPLIVLVENDIAKALGQTLYKLLDYKKQIVCIDSVEVKNGDFIDIGRPLANGRILPVIIKTLVFGC